MISPDTNGIHQLLQQIDRRVDAFQGKVLIGLVCLVNITWTQNDRFNTQLLKIGGLGSKGDCPGRVTGQLLSELYDPGTPAR